MIERLLQQGFIPYESHENGFYAVLEQEAALRSQLLTGRSRKLYVVKSKKLNMYVMRAEEEVSFIVTDSWLLHLQTSANRILSLEYTRRAFRQFLGYQYEVCLLPHPLWHGSKPPDTFFHENYLGYISLLFGTLKSAAVFGILHEISHLLKEHDSFFLNPLDYRSAPWIDEVKREYSADADATWWLANRVRDLLAEGAAKRNQSGEAGVGQPQPVAMHNLLFNFIQSFLGAMVAILFTVDEGQGMQAGVALSPHPKYDARLEILWHSFESFFWTELPPFDERYTVYDPMINALRSIIENEIFGSERATG